MKSFNVSSTYNPIPGEEEDDLMPKSNQTPKSRLPASMIAGTVVTILGVLAIAHYSKGQLGAKVVENSFKSSEATQSSQTSEYTLNFSLKRKSHNALKYFDNKYTSQTNYAHLKNYAAVVEPHAEMEFHLYEQTGNTFEFTVCSEESSSMGFNCQTGKATYEESDTVKFGCSAGDKLSISVTEFDSKMQEVGTVKESALCSYVRREMRKLTKTELNTLIDVSAKLNEVSTGDGTKKYGANYVSTSSLARLHHFGASMQNQDHIHEGNGFLLQHLKMTSMFENSLQAVDPSVVLPYWDFTIEDAEGVEPTNSIMFTKDTYGSMPSPVSYSNGFERKTDPVESAQIPDGRWAGMKIEMNPFGEDYSYGYGYMRSAWNLNPSPYLSRFTKSVTKVTLPTCESHYDILQYDDLMDFYVDSSFDPHGAVHSLVGGIYGCDHLDALVTSKDLISKGVMCDKWAFTLKLLWRDGFIEPKDCTVNSKDTDNSECGFTCKSEKKTALYNVVVNSVGSSGVNTSNPGSEDTWYNFICDGGNGGKMYPGDHLESASPSDPSFWVIHPTLDRLLHYKLMNGGFESETWRSDSVNDYVCAYAKCYDASTDKFSYSDDCCYGHYEYDRMYDGFSGDKTKFIGPTNHELQLQDDPRLATYAMPYIYDDFSWEHCSEFDFVQLADDMYLDSLARAAGKNAAGLRRASDVTRKVPRPASQSRMNEKRKTWREENAKTGL